ncbi:unnamed protein product [Paramecium octaurelia]|uniref:Uncharacterized protein n=1 Tax=Paramecium octaurelia TaxID=43137 RepID=A0A8S1YDW4_PAROT|nr:unnamed protein product [Paramecium octaurelia]
MLKLVKSISQTLTKRHQVCFNCWINSTVFSFLCGAQFDLHENGSFTIINNKKEVSPISDCIKSVTKSPNFYYNEAENHLIIDLKGFKIQMVKRINYYKTFYLIKLFLLVFQRGTDLQKFINSLDTQNKNISFDLILNSYVGGQLIEELEKKMRQDLSQYVKYIRNISVLKGAVKQGDINQIFNQESRQDLVFIKDNLILRICFGQKFSNINCKFKEYIIKRKNLDAQIQVKKLEQLILIQTNKTSYEWFEAFIFTCQNILTTIDPNVTYQKWDNFQTVFKYFEEFSNLIDGYKNIEFANTFAKSQLAQIKSYLNHLSISTLNQNKIRIR